MRDDAVLGRALPLDRGLGPIFTSTYLHKNKFYNTHTQPKCTRSAVTERLHDAPCHQQFQWSQQTSKKSRRLSRTKKNEK